MNFFDIQMYLGIKLLLLLFVALGLYLVCTKRKPIYFLLLAGTISAGAYILLVNNLDLMFWGLHGDEITIAAMYNTFAKVGLGSDFAFHGLPPFYPPGFFWFFGLIGRAMNWNGIIIAKFAACTFFLLFPIGLYLFQRYLSKDAKSSAQKQGTLFAILAPLLIMTILDKDLLFGKPYEVLAAALTIFWYISLYFKVSNEQWSKKTPFIYGAIAGLIFMTYYLWLIFATIAFIVMGLVNNRGALKKYFGRLLQTMLVALAVSIPFLVPLIISYVKFGLENWQTAFFTPDGLDLWLPMFQITSFNNILLLFGLGTLIYFRNNPFIKQLSYLFLTAFIWWGLGLLSLLLFKIPFQEFRGFYVFAPSILALSTAYGIEQLWQRFNQQITNNKNLYYVITLFGVLYFASQSIFGFWVDNPAIKNRRVESRSTEQSLANLVHYLKNDPNNYSSLTLQTVPRIMAWVPINNLLYFNQHNTHPAAIFSERFDYMQSLITSISPQELHKKIISCPFGKLERLILYHDDNYFYFDFYLDKKIIGVEQNLLKMDKKLFTPEYFDVKYDLNGYTVLEIKN